MIGQKQKPCGNHGVCYARVLSVTSERFRVKRTSWIKANDPRKWVSPTKKRTSNWKHSEATSPAEKDGHDQSSGEDASCFREEGSRCFSNLSLRSRCRQQLEKENGIRGDEGRRHGHERYRNGCQNRQRRAARDRPATSCSGGYDPRRKSRKVIHAGDFLQTGILNWAGEKSSYKESKAAKKSTVIVLRQPRQRVGYLPRKREENKL